jgi:hypothetical protein
MEGNDGFSVDDEDEGSIDWRNNIRYLKNELNGY